MDTFRKYITPGTEADAKQPDWGISILNVGHYIHPAGKKYPDAVHPDAYFFDYSKGRVLSEYQLVYIASGTGTFEAEFIGKVDVQPGTIFFLYPGIWHRFKPDEKNGWSEYWVGFGGSYANHLMKQDCFSAEHPLIYMGFNAEFINIFIQLIDTIKFDGMGSNQLAGCLTIQLLGLVYASALLKLQSSSRKAQIINNIKYSIHENLNSDISPEKLAEKHNVSYAWFRKSFKEITGQSPGQYQLNLKIQKAAKMLLETDLGICDIAYQNGFESEYYFSRLFKSKMNLSPSRYRKEFLNRQD
ncbi:helix-turn-helix domain-containing protein [Pedobacter jeongneungensis]|uniref:helix-turn-helix domain-containing protein n=1 Tax=Pedobacter jeongneungensis TaxID=947309 RepID=UPI00046A7A32|nr:AraC family transcriptional regulator [Pedobacter jeongneungensis]